MTDNKVEGQYVLTFFIGRELKTYILDGTTDEERRKETVDIVINTLTEDGTYFQGNVESALEAVRAVEIARQADVVNLDTEDPVFREAYLASLQAMKDRCTDSEHKEAYEKYLWLKARFEEKMTATEHDAHLERHFLKPAREFFISQAVNPVYKAIETVLTAAGKKPESKQVVALTQAVIDTLNKENQERTIFMERRATHDLPDQTDPAGVVYSAIIGYLEDLEHRRVYTGNGHHLAQKLADLVVAGLKERRLLRRAVSHE